MLPKLNDVEARIIGCLMEKSVTTPDQMPLTLNALTNAANQKSAREPVMSLARNEIQRTCRALAERSLLVIEENFKTGVEKYRQRLCNSTFADLRLDKAEFAVLTLLLLRGPQTPGEIRARATRLHPFADNQAVVDAARGLIDADEGEQSLLVELPRRAGRRDNEFMHQLCGPVDVSAPTPPGDHALRSTDRARIAELEQQVARLTAENSELRARLGLETPSD